ncbi:uncharacterized protein LOC128678823 [Plodia interpunctella]|uniref:uncharacterized protein LOC128678823 n=1 Tax=Plodia interpunctella TaxID=58824 RepID=UPI002368A180|nr:uncharacterized protein LOC128678823 [Plodia interpunctella]
MNRLELFQFISIFSVTINISIQECPKEVSFNGLSVTWQKSLPANNVESDPICYHDEKIVTRNCTGSQWTPAIHEVLCSKVVQYFDLSLCPPGFHVIPDNNGYCYQIHKKSAWNFPCLESGGASVITDFNHKEISALLDSLALSNTSRFFWLPAQRMSTFQPLTWYIPGNNWGRHVEIHEHLPLRSRNSKNCLLLDIYSRELVTDDCGKEYPILCFYINDLQYPAKCPEGYHAFRFMSDDGICLGIEKADVEPGLTFTQFMDTKCNRPMGHTIDDNLKRFIFKKIAEMDSLNNNTWCWYTNLNNYNTNILPNSSQIIIPNLNLFEGVINSAGTLTLLSTLSLLSCMACETEMIYEPTEFSLEYNEMEKRLFLTVYNPSGLWLDDDNDNGIQCFSNAEGFITIIKINDFPHFDLLVQDADDKMEKLVYVIDLVNDMSAQYWCEGHTKNFSLITTEKIIVNPRGSQVHVYSLMLRTNSTTIVDSSDIKQLTENITNIFKTENTLIMEITDNVQFIDIIVHLHVAINDTYGDEALNLQMNLLILKENAELEFPNYNYTLINISSSTYCLPTNSSDYITLDWELTPIGHIATPTQFCLQKNELPVKRLCKGSYLSGSVWGEVEGKCNKNYKPSIITTFLYEFVKGETCDNTTSRFLIDGLNFVLSDTDIMIPADIYYLSMSLQYICKVAQYNQSTIDMGDIENIAWVMDRVLDVDSGSLNLAQTLNSSNFLLESVQNIIELLAAKIVLNNTLPPQSSHKLAVKDQFVIQISYPIYNNITGLAILRTGFSDKFTDMEILPLYASDRIEDILSMDNLEIAAWLPDDVLLNLIRVSNHSKDEDNNLHIIINVYHNDVVFQELKKTNHVIDSRIIEISVPGYVSNLENPIPLIFRSINNTDSIKFCSFWDFQNSNIVGRIPGHWATRGCYSLKMSNNLTLCKCYHLTHFGQLIDLRNNYSDDRTPADIKHAEVLNTITLVGSFLSLSGVMGIWVTAIVFDVWRKKAGTKVLLQLSTAIALPLVLMIVFNLDNTIFMEYDGKHIVVSHMRTVCIVLGALLHYSLLANFMWMLITATLQFVRYVRVLGVSRPSRFMVKFTILGWGVPFIPVLITLILNHENYVPNPSIDHQICYPNGTYFVIGILIPICVILFVNVILFVLVIRAIAQCPDMRIPDKTLIWAQLRVSIILFFLLGLTWIFGIFSFSSNFVWSYLFCLTSTVQGFVLFVYFVICDPSTRNLWIAVIKPEFSQNSSRKSVLSISSG